MPITPVTPTPDLYLALYFAPNQATRQTATGDSYSGGFKNYPALPSAKYIYVGLFGPCPWVTYTTFDVDAIVTALCGFMPLPAVRNDPAHTFTASFCRVRYYALLTPDAAQYALNPVATTPPPYGGGGIFGGGPFA